MPHAVTLLLSGEAVAERIRLSAPDAVLEVLAEYVVLQPAHMFEAMKIIRDDPELDGKFLVQLCSVDMITRIDMVYHFSSLAQNHMFQVKVPADHEHPRVASITPLWIGANLSTAEKRLLYRPRRLYVSADADFRRALSTLLGPPLVGGIAHTTMTFVTHTSRETPVKSRTAS